VMCTGICRFVVSVLTSQSLHYFSAANIIIAHLPEMKRVVLEALDMVFIPKQIASQFVLAVALETSMVSFAVLIYLIVVEEPADAI
jgi:hypothetical protein